MTPDQHDKEIPAHLAPMLEALKSDRARADYYLSLLKPLRQYDQDYRGDLLKTLTAYLRHGGNATRTADALYLHRNSMRYRLARIHALVGLDPNDPDDRLALQIALLLSSK